MFAFVKDTNAHTWAINVEKIVRMSDAKKYVVVYFEDGTTMSIAQTIYEFVESIQRP